MCLEEEVDSQFTLLATLAIHGLQFPKVVTVDARVLGKKKPVFTGWSVPIPRDPGEGGEFTLRDLIIRLVRAEIEGFLKRQEVRRFERILSPAEIEKGESKGKIDPAARDLEQTVDEEEAIAVALQGFEDGLYIVLIDDVKHRNLDQQIHLKDDSRITLLRMVMLAGG